MYRIVIVQHYPLRNSSPNFICSKFNRIFVSLFYEKCMIFLLSKGASNPYDVIYRICALTFLSIVWFYPLFFLWALLARSHQSWIQLFFFTYFHFTVYFSHSFPFLSFFFQVFYFISATLFFFFFFFFFTIYGRTWCFSIEI